MDCDGGAEKVDMTMKNAIKLMVVLGTCLLTSQVMAEEGGGVGFSRNRLIYPSDQRAIQISVSNHGSTPYLVQSGVSGEQNKKTPAPFVVTPPLFRLEGNSQNDIRIVAAAGNLPRDRESVFYFFGTTIPGGAQDGKANGGATLSVAMRSVMKLFWRPAGLKPTPQDAPGKMQFLRDARGVRVKNPTPYYQSFARLSFDGRAQNLDGIPSMVAPFGELLFASNKPVSSVTWQVMNDYGGATPEVTQSLLSSGEK